MKADKVSDSDWEGLLNKIQQKFNKAQSPDLNAVLFLIGLRELGQNKREFSKEEKQDLIHVAMCTLMSYDGYFKLSGLDNQGWPHWEAVRELPEMSLDEQENLLKKHILRYFEQQKIFETS